MLVPYTYFRVRVSSAGSGPPSSRSSREAHGHRRHARPDPSLGLVRTARQLEQRQGAAHRQECLAALRTRARPAAWPGAGTAATRQLVDLALVSAAAPRPATGHAAQAAPVIQVDQVGSPPVLTRTRRCHSLPHARGADAKWGGRLYRHVRTCPGPPCAVRRGYVYQPRAGRTCRVPVPQVGDGSRSTTTGAR